MSASHKLSFPHVVDVKSVAGVHATLVQALGASRDLCLDLSDVEEADVSLVQLILAARRSADKQHLSLSLASPAPEHVIRMLERGGFIGPMPDDRRDFWLAA